MARCAIQKCFLQLCRAFGERRQFGRVEEHDIVGRRQRNQALFSETRHSAAHGLDGEAEMVGHLLARDRQSEGGPRLVRADPAGQLEEQGCDLLLRVLAPQEQHVLMSAGELGRGKLNQAVGHLWLRAQGRRQGGAGRTAAE